MLFDLIEESKKLIGINSVSETGTRRVVEHLVPHCKKLGFHVTLQAPGNGFGGTEMNLIAHTAPEGKGDLCPEGLALVTHLDTVPAGDLSLWTETDGDPFRATIKGDKIYGLGSADTKLDFLCKLLAIEQVVRASGRTPVHDVFKIPVALVGTFGEERALAGARLIRETKIIQPKFALISEPSSLKAVVAHKGILYMRAMMTSPPTPLLTKERVAEGRERSFKGKAAHGSMPHLGDNAVEKAMRWLIAEEGIELHEIGGGLVHNIVPELCVVKTAKSQSLCRRIAFLRGFLKRMDLARRHLETVKNPAFDPPMTTDNIGVVRMLDKDTIEIVFDFRMIPETDGNELAAIFKSLEDEVPGAQVEVIRSNAPMNTPVDSEIATRVAQAQEAVGLTKGFLVKSGNTEGAIFSDMGVQSIVIGPGKAVGNIHAPNEHNEISQMKKAIEFYSAFLKQFC